MLPKAVSESCAPKIVPKKCHRELLAHSCAAQLLQKAIRKACSPLLSKASPRICPRAALHSHKAGPQSCSQKCSRKQLPTQSCDWKLLPEVPCKYMPKSCCSSKSSVPQKLFRKAVQSCSPKLFPEAAPQSCSPKLFSKAVLQSCCPPQLRFCKPVHQNGPKAAPQNCCWELLPDVVCKAAPQKLLFFKAIVPQNCSGKLAKAAPQSGSPKLLPKAVPQSTSAKWLPQSGYASNVFPKAILQSGSPQLLPKLTAGLKLLPKNCVLKLVPKAAPQSCGSSKLPCKAAPQSCSYSPKSCSPNLLH